MSPIRLIGGADPAFLQPTTERKVMANKAEESVSKFYNTLGWQRENGVTEDARRWEDLREHAKAYVSKCRLRVLRHIPARGEKFLDAASGPIQFDEYLEYSKNYDKRYCVDLSASALEQARERIGDHGVYLHGSFFDLELEDDCFDCAVSLHTIYHMDKDRQEEAVRKLIRVTRAGQPVIIVYSNPHSLAAAVSSSRPVRFFRKAVDRLKGGAGKGPRVEPADLYFHPHSIEWWDRFRDECEVRILPWRSFGADVQKRFFPDNRFGAALFAALFRLEERFPEFFARRGQFPMIVLTRKP